ncbi:hypothetical protein CF319_g7251, partial [Tilletia indica]
MLERGDCFSPSTSTSSVAGPEHLVVPALCQPSLLAICPIMTPSPPSSASISYLTSDMPAIQMGPSLPMNHLTTPISPARPNHQCRRASLHFTRDARRHQASRTQWRLHCPDGGRSDDKLSSIFDILGSSSSSSRSRYGSSRNGRHSLRTLRILLIFKRTRKTNSSHRFLLQSDLTLSRSIALDFCSSHSFAYIRATDDPMHASILEASDLCFSPDLVERYEAKIEYRQVREWLDSHHSWTSTSDSTSSSTSTPPKASKPKPRRPKLHLLPKLSTQDDVPEGGTIEWRAQNVDEGRRAAADRLMKKAKDAAAKLAEDSNNIASDAASSASGAAAKVASKVASATSNVVSAATDAASSAAEAATKVSSKVASASGNVASAVSDAASSASDAATKASSKSSSAATEAASSASTKVASSAASAATDASTAAELIASKVAAKVF